jgi:hypothetical protein
MESRLSAVIKALQKGKHRPSCLGFQNTSGFSEQLIIK